MRRCPTCDRTYPDDSLAYCLTDGSRLVETVSPPPYNQAAPLNARAPRSNPQTTEVLHATATTARKRKNSSLPFIIIAVLAALLSLMTYLYFTKGETNQRSVSNAESNPNVNIRQLPPTPTPSVTDAVTNASASAPPVEMASPGTAPSTTDAAPTENAPAAQNVATIQKIETESFLFELKQCRLVSTTVTCELVITNQGVDREIYLDDETRMFDDANNEYKSKQVKLANKQGNWTRGLMVANVPTKTSFTFEEVPAQATKVSLLDIYCVPQNNSRPFHAQFRNFPIAR